MPQQVSNHESSKRPLWIFIRQENKIHWSYSHSVREYLGLGNRSFFFFSSDTQISLQQIERSGQKVRTPLNMAAKGAVKNERIKIVCV